MCLLRGDVRALALVGAVLLAQVPRLGQEDQARECRGGGMNFMDEEDAPQPRVRPKRKNAHPEADAQRAIVKYLRAVLIPPAILHASAHEIRGHGHEARMAQGLQRTMGAMPGWPDLVVIAQDRIVALEVKSKTGRQSEAQDEAERLWRANSQTWALVRGIDDVRAALKLAGVRTREAT
jgi:hypothetical protein